MDDEEGTRDPTLVEFEKDRKPRRKPILSRLDDRGTKMLWSFIERDASTWRFWAKIMGVMLIANTVLPAAIYLYFLGRDLGYFE